MPAAWVSIVVMGVLQLFVVLAMLWEIRTTREAYLEGRILVHLRPRESSGFVNLRIENVGAGPVEDVRLSFPRGFPAIPDGKNTVDLVDKIPKFFGTFGPREFREWNVGFCANRPHPSLPDSIPYVLEYRLPRPQRYLRLVQWIPWMSGKRRLEGELCFSWYYGVLLNSYTGVEDLHRTLNSMVKVMEKIEKAISHEIPMKCGREQPCAGQKGVGNE